MKLAPKPEMEAQLLNNLAFTSWMHANQIKKTELSDTK
jgi:hypothetical protein